MVGSVIVEIDEKYTPEIVSVMVLPEYRRKHIAAIMLEYTLDELNKKGKEKVWLVTPCDNDSAILMYKKLGFSIESHEKRYMKYI
ncbi:GNAT family N-acetyltransferase [Lachnoclostridium phytofermentans]|uniref:GNAT family N-acetyltransferase n=1 Tax=Lachnoclostridium phytofermentans TaxID=66219 RepID=UPI002418A42F|nr:GNAT family N-acetyltransferase [Lachnoclostridium phytofermentans]